MRVPIKVGILAWSARRFVVTEGSGAVYASIILELLISSAWSAILLVRVHIPADGPDAVYASISRAVIKFVLRSA